MSKVEQPSKKGQLRVNVGCGTTPVDGWLNLDNSLSVRLASLPIPWTLLLGNSNSPRMQFVRLAREKRIRWADATRRIPLQDDSTQVLYSSHMIEHLDQPQAKAFLCEAWRVLTPGGIIRIAIPDIGKFATEYLADRNADRFVESTLLATESANTLGSRLKFLFVGPRNHRWMYDGQSMAKLLSTVGFSDPVVLEPGVTRIEDPGALDLWERHDESAYIEAYK